MTLYFFYELFSVKDLQALGPAETKLLYTLHWILLFASAECSDEEDDTTKLPETRAHLFSIPTISLFVYLFAPIVHHLKESDFQNYRLENGLELWNGMWKFNAPKGVPCFTAAVKPKARQLLNSLLSPRDSLDAYCPSRKLDHNFTILYNLNKFSCSVHSDSSKAITSYEHNKHDDEMSWISSPKDRTFPETIPEEASSVEEERVVIFRIPQTACKPSYYTVIHFTSVYLSQFLSRLSGTPANFV